MERYLDLARWITLGVPVHAVALAAGGRHFLVGSEQDVRLLNPLGAVLFRYFTPGQDEMPFSVVTMSPDMQTVLAGARQGELYRLDLALTDEACDVWPLEIYRAQNDFNSLAVSDDGSVIAIGHLGPALSVLDREGQPHWRRHPDNRNPTDDSIWSVALDSAGKTLYVGSAGATKGLLAALESHSGTPLAHQRLNYRVTRLAAIAQPAGVAAVVTNGPDYLVLAFEPELGNPRWEYNSGDRITALAADPQLPLLAVGGGYRGVITLLDTHTGQVLVESEPLHATVACLAFTDGCYLVAGTQDGQVAYMQYRTEEFQL